MPTSTALPPQQQQAPGPMGAHARRWRGLLLTAGTLGALQALGALGSPVSNPGPIYLLAVAAAALDGGRLVGLASAVAALAYAAWFFAAPGEFASYAPEDIERLAILIIVTPTMAVLVGTLRTRAAQVAKADKEAAVLRERLAERAREAARLRCALSEREVLLLELGHRVGNAMQTVSALVAFAEREATSSSVPNAALKALRGLGERIRHLCHVQAMLLRRDGTGAVDAAAYLAEIAQRVRTIHGTDAQVSLRLDLESLPLTPTAAAPLGLLLYEVLSNAFGRICCNDDKAHPATAAPDVAVKLRREPDGRTRLVVENRNRGRGLTPRPGSIRARLVAALARQIGGAVEYEAAAEEGSSRLSLLAPPARVTQGAGAAALSS